MDVRSTYKGARISARKVRDVTREIQGLPVSHALDLLAFTPRKAARLVAKTLKAAVADAENNFELAVDSLVIKEATAGEGPTMKRFMPRARGSASPIRKRTSRINIVLTEDADLIEAMEKTSERKRKKAAPKKKAAKKTTPKAKKESKAEVTEPAGEEETVVEEVVAESASESTVDSAAEETAVDSGDKENTAEDGDKK